MRRALPDVLPWVLVVAASTAAMYLLHAQPELEDTFEWFSPLGHPEVVTAVSVICALLAGVVSVVALRSPNPRLLWLALAFLSMSGFYVVHGLTTPGVILEQEHAAVIGFSGRMAFLTCAMFLAGSSVDWKGRRAEAVARHRGLVLVLTVAGLLAYAGIALWWPELVPAWFAPGGGKGPAVEDGY